MHATPMCRCSDSRHHDYACQLTSVPTWRVQAARLAPSQAFQKNESRAALVVSLAGLLGSPAAPTRVAAAGECFRG